MKLYNKLDLSLLSTEEITELVLTIRQTRGKIIQSEPTLKNISIQIPKDLSSEETSILQLSGEIK